MNILKRLIPLLFLTIAASFAVAAEKNPVFAKGGNIFYTNGKQTIQLTRSKKDDSPVLSPDGKIVAFTRKTARESFAPCEGEPGRTQQLWLVNVDGKHEKMLVRDRRGEPQNQIDQITGIEFSLDGRKIYFNTDGWIMSGALHCVNIDGSREHFVIDADYSEVIEKGEYKGNLIVSRHKYFFYGPSYDWFYIVTPQGKEIGPLADDEKNIPWERLYGKKINNIDKKPSPSPYVKVIEKGEYKGMLIMSQRRYYLCGGSYDWFYVFNRNGEEIGPLADDEKNIPWEDLYKEPVPTQKTAK
ncbi:MAG: PD40 domain-containing protein [Verrucomicrobia bacterium]|nr:PD40 domain-containing protein [Verrucomicrobiota bacterium]